MKSILMMAVLLASAPQVFAAPTKPAAASATPRIAALDKLGIAYKITKREFNLRPHDLLDPKDRAAEDNYVLNIDLGRLTKAQFDSLKARYAVSQVTYGAARSYQLTDFLSPMIQATAGKQFNEKQEKFDWPEIPDSAEMGVEEEELQRFRDTESTIDTYTNCWTTAHEVWRHLNAFDAEIDITWLSRITALGKFTDDETSVIVKKGEALRFGDAIVYSNHDEQVDEELIQHAAIYVDDGIYFEKTDSTVNDAYRLVLASDVEGKFNKLFGKKLKRNLRRLKPEARLPRLKDTIVLAAMDPLYAKYFSADILKSVAIEIEIVAGMMSAQRKGGALRVSPVRLLKNAKTGLYSIDPASPIAKQFVSPLFK